MTRRLILQVVPFDSMYEINGSVTYYIKKTGDFYYAAKLFYLRGSLTVEYQEKYLQVL